MKLGGRTALVTGADSGIGQAIAITFAREGADVVVHYHADEQGAHSTARQIQEHGRRAEIVQADLSDPRAAQRLFQEALQRVEQIDILVNNAGTGAPVEKSLETPLDEFIRVINIDMVSPWALCQAAAQQMIERGGGVIINITSVHEEIPGPAGSRTMRLKVVCATSPARLPLSWHRRGCGSIISHRA